MGIYYQSCAREVCCQWHCKFHPRVISALHLPFWLLQAQCNILRIPSGACSSSELASLTYTDIQSSYYDTSQYHSVYFYWNKMQSLHASTSCTQPPITLESKPIEAWIYAAHNCRLFCDQYKCSHSSWVFCFKFYFLWLFLPSFISLFVVLCFSILAAFFAPWIVLKLIF